MTAHSLKFSVTLILLSPQYRFSLVLPKQFLHRFCEFLHLLNVLNVLNVGLPSAYYFALCISLGNSFILAILTTFYMLRTFRLIYLLSWRLLRASDFYIQLSPVQSQAPQTNMSKMECFVLPLKYAFPPEFFLSIHPVTQARAQESS